MKQQYLVPCLVGMVFAAVMLVALGVSAGTLAAGTLALACPLMMILMMGGMMHGHGHARRSDPGGIETSESDARR